MTNQALLNAASIKELQRWGDDGSIVELGTRALNMVVLTYAEESELTSHASYEDGRVDGHEEGYDQGFDWGHEEGYTEGNKAGYDEGYAAALGLSPKQVLDIVRFLSVD